MYGNVFVLFFVIFCTSAISIPMNGDGQGENPVVNMNVNGEQGNANPNQNSGTETVENKVADNPIANQETNAHVNQETNAQANQEAHAPVDQATNAPVIEESNIPADQDNHPPANQDNHPPANQEHSSLPNQESNSLGNQEGNHATNDGNSHQNDRQQLNDNIQVVANENTHKPVEQQKEEVDWGHADSNRVDVNLHISKLQVEQEQSQEQHQQTEQQQTLQQEVPTDKTEIGHDASESTQQGHTGEQTQGNEVPQQGLREGQTNAHQDIGVEEPEQVIHGDEGHGDHHDGPENATRLKEQEAERAHDAQERIDAEKKEMDEVRPKVMGGNVHDSTSRRVAEFIKDKQFAPDNAEEAIHGGQHVHGENAEGNHQEVHTGDVENIVHGEEGVHDEHHKQDDKAPLTVDPDEMMHTGEGGHPHDRHENEPGGETPNGTFVQGNNKEKQSHAEKGVLGPEVEPIVHDGDHVHDKTASHRTKNKVRYQDIIDLGLSQELLKGIDLSKLLEQEKEEMEAFHKERNDKDGVKEEDINDTERNALFWQRVTELRRTYLEKLYAKVRHLSNPNPDNAGSEGDERKGGSLHKREGKARDDIDEWTSTVSIGNKNQHISKTDSSQKDEEVLKEDQENHSEHEEAAFEAKHAEENAEKTSDHETGEYLHKDQNEHHVQDVGESIETNAGEASEDDL